MQWPERGKAGRIGPAQWKSVEKAYVGCRGQGRGSSWPQRLWYSLVRAQPVLQRIISSKLKYRLSSVTRSSLCSKSHYGTSIVVRGIVHAFAEPLIASRGTGDAWEPVCNPQKHAETWRADESARAGGYTAGPAFLLKPL